MDSEEISRYDNKFEQNENKTNNEKDSNSMKISDIPEEEVLKFPINAYFLIIDNNAELLKSNFCSTSDIVTIFNSLYEFSKNSTKYNHDSGFSLKIVNLIYQCLEEKFGFNGCNLIIFALNKYENQENSI